MSKFRILHSNNEKELIIGNYTLEEAKDLKKKYTRFWGTFNNRYPTNKSPRHKAWAESKITPIESFSNRFVDFDIVIGNEYNKKNTTGVLSKIVDIMDMENVQNKINRYLTAKRLSLQL